MTSTINPTTTLQLTTHFTTTAEAATQADTLRELSAARVAYEERLGWPVTIDVRSARLVLPTGPVTDAVTMPALLGRPVLADLRIAMLAGPVVASTDGRSWTFFAGPGSHFHPSEDVAAELSRLDVELLPTDTYVGVPTHLGNGTNTPWPWIEPPKPLRDLPPMAAVIATARRNAARLLDRV